MFSLAQVFFVIFIAATCFVAIVTEAFDAVKGEETIVSIEGVGEKAFDVIHKVFHSSCEVVVFREKGSRGAQIYLCFKSPTEAKNVKQVFKDLLRVDHGATEKRAREESERKAREDLRHRFKFEKSTTGRFVDVELTRLTFFEWLRMKKQAIIAVIQEEAKTVQIHVGAPFAEEA